MRKNVDQKNCEYGHFLALLDIKICSGKKRLIGKLVLECEDETLNTNETSINDKKETRGKTNCLTHTILLIIICTLLLVIISVGCY